MRRTLPSSVPRSSDPVAQRILASARTHFLAHGFRGVTMSELAAEIGMSKKTLYAHFPSKSALVEAVINSKISAAEADLVQIASNSAFTFPEVLRHLLSRMQEHVKEIQPTFVRDMSKEAPELIEQLMARRRKLIHRTFGKLLAAGREAGAIREDIPIDFLIEILIGATEAIVNPERLAARGELPGECFPSIIAVFLHGVLTETGRKNV
jgi:AcrR family transcriptional regulator